MAGTMEWLCECDAENCMTPIAMATELAARLSREGLIAIADGCANGPSPGDELLERKDGFALYRPAK